VELPAGGGRGLFFLLLRLRALLLGLRALFFGTLLRCSAVCFGLRLFGSLMGRGLVVGLAVTILGGSAPAALLIENCALAT
jgi:hypothetical protein